MKEIRIGILGFGTVGAGVVEGIQKNGALMADRTGINPVVARIADLDITTDRGIVVSDGVLTTDAMSIIHDPSIDLIVELVGGTTIARTFTLEALTQGKPVITANKALLADHGEEIYRTARENNTGIYYEAATNAILDDLVAACAPRWMELTGAFSARGGISTTVSVRHDGNS